MLDIKEERARGLTELKVNGFLFTMAPVHWNRWHITPNSKVWSKKSYIWKPTNAWKKYCAFKDAVAATKAPGLLPLLFEPGYHVIFHMPVSDSWSQKKKLSFIGQPHEFKPDVDGLLAGLFDAVFPVATRGGMGDQHIHSVGSLKKVWAWSGGIEIGRPV